ncbi:ribonuclease BN [Legionella busanensis]|uniref:Ribonuclease BN n=1 Tax=Legionella busanensis TaxID=190655 RepID=A0A378JG51_9GAMM|nr:YihY/virulence factor BrkB family protein [Legionella busanensis]STX50094.1 ribonuclease BN [Legionella busanensis]
MSNKYINYLKDLYANYSEDRIAVFAAALAYYTAFALAPFLIICTSVVGLVYSHDAAQGQIIDQIRSLVGKDSADLIQTMIVNASKPSSGITAQIVSIILLIIATSGVFGQIQMGLNYIWGVEPKPGRGVWGIIKDRFLSFTIVLGVAFLLLVSLILSVVITFMSDYLSHILPGGDLIAWGLNFAISLAVITLLFAMIFKILPDVELTLRDVIWGAFWTAVLFTIGKTLLGIYLGQSHVANAFGPAGSLIIILIWVYYTAQILFIGAELTKMHVTKHGKKVKPDVDAYVKEEKPHLTNNS